MPVTVSYPGVYVEEIPSGVHTITGVATSITAFVGATQRGPVNDPISVFSYGDFATTFGGMTTDLLPGSTVAPLYAVAFAVNDFFLNGGSQAIIVRVVNDAPADAPAAGGAAAAPAAGGAAAAPAAGGGAPEPPAAGGAAAAAAPKPTPPATAAQIALGSITLSASSPGSWGNSLTALVDFNTKSVSNPPTLFNLTVTELVPGTTQVVLQEVFYNLSIVPTDSTYVATFLPGNSQLVTYTGGVPASTPDAPKKDAKSKPIPVVATGGTDGPPVGSLQIFDPSLEQQKMGIYALDNTDIFNLLVIPPYASPMAIDDVEELVAAAAAYCSLRRAFLLVDPPDAWDAQPPAIAANTIAADLGTLRSASQAPSNAAVFYPRLLKPNPLMSNQIQKFPPSGTMAGICARTDAQRGVWKAPAGIDATLAGATGLTVVLNNAENGLFNPIGVNCLRTFPVIGSVAWGSRTLNGADVLSDDYKYIPIRRFALFLEESLYRGTQWVVFEPNAEPLWSQIRLTVGSFMQTLFRQGAFAGSSASQAYFVKCDDESTTQVDVDNGIVNVVVGFAPLRPAEFVILQIEQMAGTIAT